MNCWLFKMPAVVVGDDELFWCNTRSGSCHVRALWWFTLPYLLYLLLLLILFLLFSTQLEAVTIHFYLCFHFSDVVKYWRLFTPCFAVMSKSLTLFLSSRYCEFIIIIIIIIIIVVIIITNAAHMVLIHWRASSSAVLFCSAISI